MTDALFDLTSFQRDLLYISAGEERPSGQEIKKELQQSFGDISHGRLYPNLESLVEKGYIQKGQIDRRTNFYETTPEGLEALRDRREWENRYVEFS